jgi:dimethylhistidine N-methyltransferase
MTATADPSRQRPIQRAQERIPERHAVVLDIDPAHAGASEAAEGQAEESRGRQEELAAFRADALHGLGQPQKSIPSKYLYDARGAALFEEITRVPEYYPTRTEVELLRAHAREIAAAVGPGATIVEPGSGAGEKVRILVDALDTPRALVPVDIAREQLRRVARTLAERHRDLEIVPLWADFTRPIDVPDRVAGMRPRLVFFPGSTIGNFLPPVQRELLVALAHLAGPDGSLLIGFDRIKDPSVLIPAYDDAAGVTRAFEMNILTRLNRELDADFDPTNFRYEARWNAADARVEMHLVATRDHDVTVAGQRFAFAKGESLWNESSHKYDPERIEALAASANLRVAESWSDAKDGFTIALLRPGAS